MTNIVQGNNCLCQFNTTGTFKTLVCSKSFTITVETETKETTTRGDAGWRDYDYKTLGYTLTLSGLLKIIDSSGDNTYHDLLVQQINFLEVQYRIIYTDPAGNISLAAGTVIITRTTINTPAGALVESDIEMIGKGAFGVFQVSEFTTVDFKKRNGLLDPFENFDSTNSLAEGEKTYKLSDFKLLLISSATTGQQATASFTLPKFAGASFTDDWSASNTGLSNIQLNAFSSGSDWAVTVTFDYTPSTSDKSLNFTPV